MKIRVKKIKISNNYKIKNFRFIVRGGTPAFLIFVKSSEAEKRFLMNY